MSEQPMRRSSDWSKSISVGHLIATVGLVVSGFAFIYDLRESIALSDFKINTMEKRFERMEDRTQQQFDKIVAHLGRLEDKMDSYFNVRHRFDKGG